MIKRLAHVCFFTDNATELLGFYREAFGFEIAFEMKLEDGTPFGWYLDCGNDTFIEIFDQKGAVQQWGGEIVPLKEDAGSRFKHICLEVAELQELRSGLVGKGFEVTEIIKGMDHSYQCWIKDPDGNSIELMEYTAESLQFSKRK